MAKDIRAALAHGETVWSCVVHDGISSRLAVAAGFEALSVGGYAVAATLGYPDVGLVTLTETVQVSATCVRAGNRLPTIIDGDTGYGNATNVMRTVRELEQVGAAGVQFEDQVAPKRCPQLQVNELIPLEEAVGKIEAATHARRSRDFLIFARTDARDPGEALVRGRAYAAAGADAIYVTSNCFSELQGLVSFRRQLGIPLSFGLFGWTEQLDAKEIDSIGGAFVLWPFVGVMTMAHALEANLKHLKSRKSTVGMPYPVMGQQRFAQLLGYQELQAWQQRHGGLP